MRSDGTFPTTTPRWLVEVRTYWAALTTERKYRRNERSTEDFTKGETEASASTDEPAEPCEA